MFLLVLVWLVRASLDPARAQEPLPPGAALDNVQRLARWPGKQEVACPARDEKVATILVLGQSNAGNHAQRRAAPPVDDGVLNWYAGKCYLAASPLLGATGQSAEPWTLMARHVLLPTSRKGIDRVVLAPIAVSGSAISRWTDAGDLRPVLESESARLASRLRVTAVLWVQGEADFLRATGRAAYSSMLAAVVKSLRSSGIDAPVYVYVATRCAQSDWVPDNPVAAAQRSASDAGARIGVDLDAKLTPADRFDGCHLSDSGVGKVAEETARLVGELL